MSDESTSPTTRLLTLLNVSAGKSLKRKRIFEEPSPTRTLNKREQKKAAFSGVETEDPLHVEDNNAHETVTREGEDTEEIESTAGDVEDMQDVYEQHFNVNTSILTDSVGDNRQWISSASSFKKLGPAVMSVPSGSPHKEYTKAKSLGILERLQTPFGERQAKLPLDRRELQNDVLSTLSGYRDLYHTHASHEIASSVREAIALHALNHVSKKRRRILKNNERLAHATKNNTPIPEDVQDQGFTRPTVLILLPFRSSALSWFDALAVHTPPPTYQIENLSRFRKEFGLPEGAIDKLATAEPGTYPRDHVETFKGNIDDNFRVGLKVTRKSVRLFSEFYNSDIIIASPLGLRISIEKEKNWDFLSSIELLVVDQTDALTMQNWEHVQFVLSHINQLPKESHNTDFSRIMPWYLDGLAASLRQSVILTAYETPEIRNLFNNSLKNVAGKVRTTRQWAPVQVPDELDQNFIQFECTSVKDEPDKRFSHFTTQILPAILKSAVQSANTAIFIPNSLDFVRIQNHFRKQELSFTVLSEYSSNQDISRARQAFFLGKKSFLLVSERFHFYRRYKIRGIRNLVFYGPPDHSVFYTELLSFPFLDDDVEPSDVTCRVLYSRYDWFRMERITGTKGASQLIRQGAM